jgi:hypothetical protein
MGYWSWFIGHALLTMVYWSRAQLNFFDLANQIDKELQISQ